METLGDKWSFDWDAYHSTTSDGYILSVFNILPTLGPGETEPKASVLIQHGNTNDGASWLEAYGNEKPFHVMLAEQGYDVWIGNNRGTEYSQGHTTLTANGATTWSANGGAAASEYWDFSWADMAKDDKAQIKTIQEVANVDQVIYIGYSLGTT